MGGGRKVGRVGFEHDALERYRGFEHGRQGALLEGHDPPDAEQEAVEGQELFGLASRSAETVEDAARELAFEWREHFEQFGVSGTGVNDER